MEQLSIAAHNKDVWHIIIMHAVLQKRQDVHIQVIYHPAKKSAQDAANLEKKTTLTLIFEARTNVYINHSSMFIKGHTHHP